MSRKFSVLASAAIKDMTARGSPATTTDAYDIAAHQFGAFLTSGYQDDVRYFTAPVVARFVESLTAHRAHPGTIRQKLAALRAVARFGLRWPSLDRPTLMTDPTLPIVRPRSRRKNQPIPLPAELRALLAVPLSPRLRLVRDIIIDTGLRSSELCRATVGALQEHPDGYYLAVTVKGGDEALAPLSPEIVEQLRDDLLARNMPAAAERLLVREDGTAWGKSTLNWFIRSLGTKAGITRFRLGPHKLRHLAANLGKDEVDPLTRSRLLNHASPLTIKHYDHALPGELRAARQAQRRALLRYLGAPENPPPQIDAGALARVLAALGQIPADRLEAALEALERLAWTVHCSTESEPRALNASDEKPNAGAGVGDLSS
jgi:integrase